MATTGSALKRSLAVAITVVIVSGCSGSITSNSAGSSPATSAASSTAKLPDDPGVWQRIELPGGPPGCNGGCLVRSVAAGSAGLVATGSHFMSFGEAFAGWSSLDGLSWQQIQTDSGEVEGLATVGPGFIAAAPGGLYSSTDGVTWDRVRSTDPGDAYLGVAAGGPGYVAVGSPGKAWFSSDGLTWVAATVPATSLPPDMTKVATSGDRLVAMGSSRHNDNRTELAIWVSSDGTSWREVPLDNTVFSSSCRITGLAGSAPGFVATGWCGSPQRPANYLAWRSDDGVTWSRVGDALAGRAYVSVNPSPSGFIATDSHRIWTSDDGASWTPVPTGSAFQGAEAISVIAWGSRLVAVGDTNDHRNMVWISGPLR